MVNYETKYINYNYGEGNSNILITTEIIMY